MEMALTTIRRLKTLEIEIGRTLIVTNGFRCEKHNAEEGGHPQSRHLDGLAIDVVDPKIPNFYEIAHRYFNGVKHYPEKRIWHLQVPKPRS
jgi:uncharacterized protein YcbK (DUF882 family)